MFNQTINVCTISVFDENLVFSVYFLTFLLGGSLYRVEVPGIICILLFVSYLRAFYELLFAFWYLHSAICGATIYILLFLSIQCFQLMACYSILFLYSSCLISFVFCIHFLNLLLLQFCSYYAILFFERF